MVARVTVLGSGDAFGTPKPGCHVAACAANGVLNTRSRFSLLIQVNGRNLLVGAAPDLRQQFIREKISLASINDIFLTHVHYDQTGGLGEFDSIGNRPSISVFGNPNDFEEINRRFSHLFEKKRFVFKPVDINKTITSDHFSVTPFELNHHHCPCLGFRFVIDNKVIVIAVDTNASLPATSLELMLGADVLFLDGMAETTREILLAKRDLSQKTDAEFKATVDANKRGHMLISEAINLSKKLKAKTTILTHICHFNSPHEELAARYETRGVRIGYDGMAVNV